MLDKIVSVSPVIKMECAFGEALHLVLVNGKLLMCYVFIAIFITIIISDSINTNKNKSLKVTLP
jgi:hypothetical protein